jgi:hypothetical protein
MRRGGIPGLRAGRCPRRSSCGSRNTGNWRTARFILTLCMRGEWIWRYDRREFYWVQLRQVQCDPGSSVSIRFARRTQDRPGGRGTDLAVPTSSMDRLALAFLLIVPRQFGRLYLLFYILEIHILWTAAHAHSRHLGIVVEHAVRQTSNAKVVCR